MDNPSAPAQSPNETQENYKFICHGCNILLRQTTSRFQKWEYEGPGRCIGCEFFTGDGYVVSRMSVLHQGSMPNSSAYRTRGAGTCGKASRIYKKRSIMGHEPGGSGDTATTAGIGGFAKACQPMREGNVFIGETK